MTNSTLKLLMHSGTLYRMNGIIQAVQEGNCSDEVLQRIKELKESPFDVLNIKESDLAIAADYLLTGTTYNENEIVDNLVAVNLQLGEDLNEYRRLVPGK